MAMIGLHAALLQGSSSPAGPALITTGLLAALLCISLWWCTGMIYACLCTLREWATVLTPLSFIAIGLASGSGLAAAWFACIARASNPTLSLKSSITYLCITAFTLTLLAMIVKGAWFNRLLTLRPRSTLQSALGISHRVIRQLSTGMTGGNFNTKEFSHGHSTTRLRTITILMVVLGAILPIASYGTAWQQATQGNECVPADLMGLGFILQLLGTLAERWLFFALVQHPLNLYYQRVS
jgi:DMSO reductase anchor subunit